MPDPLNELVGLLREDDPLLATGLRPPAGGDPQLGALAASGPRAAGHEAEYALLIEAIREGFELHYRNGRVLDPEDDDLSLLAGDRLYALGLERLAELGDVEAIAELADVISLCAQAEAAADPELSEAIWRAGARATGWGSESSHEQAKQLAREGDGEAVAALDRSGSAGPRS
jgi:hypothetical protein